MDTRIKASFGTALKLFDTKHPGHSTAMAVATVLAFLLTPPTKMFVDNITSRALWTELHHRLLPQRTSGSTAWRGCSRARAHQGRDRACRSDGPVAPAATSPITTGSILPGPASEPAADEKPKGQ